MSKQPEALIAAEYLETIESPCAQMGAAELRRLHAANVELASASINARDMLTTDRQAFVDCQRLRDSRTEDPIAHGLAYVDEDTWLDENDAEVLREYDRAIALIDAAIAKHGATS